MPNCVAVRALEPGGEDHPVLNLWPPERKARARSARRTVPVHKGWELRLLQDKQEDQGESESEVSETDSSEGQQQEMDRMLLEAEALEFLAEEAVVNRRRSPETGPDPALQPADPSLPGDTPAGSSGDGPRADAPASSGDLVPLALPASDLAENVRVAEPRADALPDHADAGEAVAGAAAPPAPGPEVAVGGAERGPKLGPLLRIEIGDHLNLRYDHRKNNMVAHCTWPGHAPTCRMSRTCNASASRPGQGRPLGELLAWGALQAAFATAHDHQKYCLPSLEERQEARRAFAAKAGAGEWQALERAPRDGEPEEPDTK